MNITPTTIYWITRLDSVMNAIGIVAIISILSLFASGIVSFLLRASSLGTDQEERCLVLANLVFKVSAIVFAASLVIGTFVPSAKEFAAMIVVPRVANSESLQDIGTGIVGLAKAWLEELKTSKESK